MPPALAQHLRETILAVLEGSHSEDQVNRLVKACYALAYPFVLSKHVAGPANHAALGLSASDLTYDLIGDLFLRDDRGALLHFKAYFSALEVSALDDVRLVMHLRRLVFSAVNQGLYRLYRQLDPAFGKILRNIKLSIAALQNFTELERFGEPCLAPAMADPLLGCPPFDVCRLEQMLLTMVSGSDSIPTLLAALSLVLRQQNDYCRILPLTLVASLFRSVYVHRQAGEADGPDPHGVLFEENMRLAIERASREAVRRMLPVYCRENDWDGTVTDAYAAVVKQNLLHRVLGQDGEEFSYYKGLRAQLPNLTMEEYRARHKNKVEYVGRLAYELLVTEFRKELT